MIVFILIFGLLVILIMYFVAPTVRHWNQMWNTLDKIPGPPALPFLGNVLQFIGSQEQLWISLRSLAKEYYPIFRLRSPALSFVNICNPDDAEILLSSTKNITKGTIYNFLHDWFRTGLLTSTGIKWQQRRKILTPSFHFNILREFCNIFNEEGHHMVHELQSENGPVTIDVVSFATKHTLNTICKTAMGASLSSTENSKDGFEKIYRKSVHDLGQMIIYRILHPWLHLNLIFFSTTAGQLYNQYLKIVRGFSKKIIGERKKYHENTQNIYLKNFNDYNEDTDVIYQGSSKKKLAMLDLLIAAMNNGHMNDDGIQEEVDTFMFEGHDTTAIGLCFALLLIAEHGDIQQRIRDEIDETLKKCNGHMGITELQQLPYLERCIKESLRLYPSVPYISRLVSDNMNMHNYLIPAGVTANILIYDIHRDPNFWPDPNRYDPDRFLPERIQGRHPYSYIPFSAGPRNCIGQKFAIMELKAMIGHLIHNFYLEPVDLANNVCILTDLVIRPKDAARIKFIPR